MPKLSLLQITQKVLSALGDDEVNSISDTLESLSLVEMIQDVYYEYITDQSPWLCRTSTLDSVSDTAKPNYLKLGSSVSEIRVIRYDTIKSAGTKADYKIIQYLSPEDFLVHSNARDSSASDVKTVTDYGGAKLYIKDDVAPTYYTSFDDEYIVFDSYDKAVDSTLQGSKAQVVAMVIPSWTVSDSFIPDLPEEQFPAFLAECKSQAFYQFKQASNPKIDDVVRRQNARAKQYGWRVKGGFNYPNYGRRR